VRAAPCAVQSHLRRLRHWRHQQLSYDPEECVLGVCLLVSDLIVLAEEFFYFNSFLINILISIKKIFAKLTLLVAPARDSITLSRHMC
jgi:hypothetical protein